MTGALHLRPGEQLIDGRTADVGTRTSAVCCTKKIWLARAIVGSMRWFDVGTLDRGHERQREIEDLDRESCRVAIGIDDIWRRHKCVRK